MYPTHKTLNLKFVTVVIPNLEYPAAMWVPNQQE